MKRLNEQKRRIFLFNMKERESQIEKDNLNLLTKLEQIKRKGSHMCATRQPVTKHSAFLNPERVKSEHRRKVEYDRAAAARRLDRQNLKLATVLHNASSCIDTGKQLNDYSRHTRIVQMHEDHMKRKLYGNPHLNNSPSTCLAPANPAFKTGSSTTNFKLAKNFKLPPLHFKTIFNEKTELD